jgi:hypothetical protein
MNRAELIRQSRKLDRKQMTKWLEKETGKKITSSTFDKIMHDALPLERAYQSEVIVYLKTIPGAFVWKATAGPHSQRGIPDVCAIIDGHFFGFEIKRPYIGKATKLQEETIRRINEVGGTAAVICFREQAKAIIDKWKQRDK